MQRKTIIEIIAALLILLLVYASLSKLLAYSVFVAQLHTHPMLKQFAGFLAWAVPVVELGLAALLVIPKTSRAGFYGAAALLLTFTAYLVLMLLSEKNLPCSCGGIISSLSWGQHVVFNLFFTALAITGIILDKRKNRTALRPGETLARTSFTP